MELTNLVPVIELLHNIMYIASAYNQFWTIKAFDTACGKHTIALVDERSGEEKLVFHNPDEKMAEFVEEVRSLGWDVIKHKYLGNPENFDSMRVYLCDSSCDCACHSKG